MPAESAKTDNVVSKAPAGGTSRRGVMYGAGLMGVAGVVAACGGDDGDDEKKEEPSGALAKTREIPVGGGKIIAAQKVVVTQPAPGKFKAFGTRCPHKGCAVDKVEKETIKCPCHGSVFKADTGAVITGPAPNGLEEKKIKVDGDQIKLA